MDMTAENKIDTGRISQCVCDFVCSAVGEQNHRVTLTAFLQFPRETVDLVVVRPDRIPKVNKILLSDAEGIILNKSDDGDSDIFFLA